MAEIDSMLLNLRGEIENANAVKDIVLYRLCSDKILSIDQAKEYSEKWQMIVFKKNWFKKWADVFVKGEVENYQYKFVRFED